MRYIHWSKLWQSSWTHKSDLLCSLSSPPQPIHSVWLRFYVILLCKVTWEIPHLRTIKSDTLRPCAARKLIHLGSSVKSRKYTAPTRWSLCRCFWGFTRYYEEHMERFPTADGSSLCLRRVKRCEQVHLRCWHWLGWEYIWGVNVFITLAMLPCFVFTQYFIPISTVWQWQVTQHTLASAGTEAALVSGFGS